MELRVCSSCRRIAPGHTACPGCHQPLTLAEPDFLLGSSLGKYRLDRLLGTGGMGAVFLATHTTLNRPAALKIVLPQHADPEFEKRFLREARTLAELKHPNIVEVYDYDLSDWGMPYFVMEYLAGETLRDLIGRHPSGLEPGELAPILDDVAAGLAHAHRHGVVHRDLKPENIFLTAFDQRRVAKILDFGIAKVTARLGPEDAVTRTGTLVGTPSYLAPEQVTGGHLAPATDQYALALIVAEMLTGRAVRAGKTTGQIFSDEVRRPIPPAFLGRPDLPPSVNAALHRATQPDPERRFPDVASFVHALGLASRPPSARTGQDSLPTAAMAGGAAVARLDSSPTTAIPGSPSPSRATWRRAQLRLAVAGAAVVAVAVVAVIVLHGRTRRNSSQPAPARTAALSLRRSGELPVPLDTVRVLGARDNTLVAGAACVYLVPEGQGQAPTRLPLSPGQEVVGVTDDFRLLVRDRGQVRVLDPTSGRADSWAEGLPEGGDLRLSPTGDLGAVVDEQRIRVFRLEGGRAQPSFEVPLAGSRLQEVTLGERYLAVVSAGEVAAYSLVDGQERLRQPFAEYHVEALALQDEAGLVAVGGWFDRVEVLAIADGSRSVIPRAAQTHDLLFLPDGPTLVIAGDDGLTLWRQGAEAVPVAESSGSRIANLAASGGHLLALELQPRKVLRYACERLAIERTVAAGAPELWGLVADPTGPRLLAGSADGTLCAISTIDGSSVPHRVHTLGITSLVADGTFLASASDDKTIAVWRLPSLELVWRSRAHDFLVNHLSLDRRSSTLWSSSSDGTIKRWAWPNLEELESVNVTRLLGHEVAPHALWVSPDGRTVLVGTWQRELVVLDRTAAGWSAGALLIRSQCGYDLAHLPAVEAVLVVGAGERGPFQLYLYDLKRRRLLVLDNAVQVTTGAIATGARAVAFGDGVVLDYHFERRLDGTIAYTVAAYLHAGLGFVTCTTLLPDGRVALGTVDGRVHLLSLDQLDARPLFRGAG